MGAGACDQCTHMTWSRQGFSFQFAHSMNLECAPCSLPPLQGQHGPSVASLGALTWPHVIRHAGPHCMWTLVVHGLFFNPFFDSVPITYPGPETAALPPQLQASGATVTVNKAVCAPHTSSFQEQRRSGTALLAPGKPHLSPHL